MKGPLVQHHERYSRDGLFRRYLRGQINFFWPRIGFLVMVSLMLGIVASPLTGGCTLLLSCFAEVLNWLYLRYAYRQIKTGAATKPLRQLSAVTAFLHAVALALGAAAPYWAEPLFGKGGEIEVTPIFTIGLMVSGAINAGLTYPYHRPTAIARLIAYGTAAFLVLLFGPLDYHTMSFQLQLAGVLILCGSLTWHVLFVIRSFERTRSGMLTQALQQQELEGAYQRLLDQQVEAKRLALVARHANDSVLLIDADNRCNG